MLKNYPFSQIREKLTSAQKILVALPANPNFDAVAAALAFQLALVENGKNAVVYCPTPMTVEFNHLVGVDQISSKLQGTDLILTLNYAVDQIERVSYNDDNNQPNIVIQPKAGAPQLSESLATYRYSGVGADLIFTVGVTDLDMLNNPELFDSTKIVNIDYEPSNLSFGSINVIDPQASTYSEMILALVSGLSLTLANDTAQNLIDGVWNGTNGLLGPNTGADTYEAVAICLRAGAIKPEQPIVQPKKENIIRPKTSVYASPEQPVVKPTVTKKDQPPSEWLQPKIYRGTSTV